MRRRLSFLLMMLLILLLSGCGAAENGLEDALTFRSVLQEHGGCTFTANVIAEVEDRGYQFSLQSEYRCGGEAATVTVTEPETLRGITASVTGTDALLSFDGVQLDFGKLDDAMASPLYGPWAFGAGWDTAYLDCGGMDGDSYRVTSRLGYDEEELILETWFAGNVPVRCELYREETLLLSATIESFNFLS